jgi:hypothetical protein
MRLNSSLNSLDRILCEIFDSNVDSAFQDGVHFRDLKNRNFPAGLPENLRLSFAMRHKHWFPQSFGEFISSKFHRNFLHASTNCQ